MSEDPSWMPNREREGSAPAEAERERRRQLGSAGELSRSASPSVLPNNYPIVSLRQQLALIKQMEQPSPSGSTDGASVDGMAVGAATASGSLTPAGKKKIPKIHKKNDRGETPLHVAARKGDERQCVELLDAGAEVNCADYAGWTPLHEATAHGRWTTADMLLKRGANVNAASIDEETPLHDAAYNANAPLVWLLLSHGADKEKKNKKGERAMDICDEESRAYALLMLQSGELPAQRPDESPEGSPAPSSRKASPPHAAPVKVTEKPASLPPPPPAAAASLIDEPHLPPSVPISISVASPARWSTPPETVPVVVVPSPRQSPATRPSPSPRKTPSVSPREKEAQPAERAPVPVETAESTGREEREEREESPVPMRVEADIDTSPEMDPEAEPPMDDPTLSPTKEHPVEQVEQKGQKEGDEEEKDTDRTLDATDPMIMQEAEVEKEQEQDEPMEEEDDAPLEIDEGEEEADSPALQVAEEEEMEQDKPEEEQQEQEVEKDEDEESVEMGAPVVEQEQEKPAAAAAVWKQHVLLEKKAESVPPPDDSHAFDFAEEDDESKSARGRSEERTEPKRGRGRGRGRGRPAGHSSSGSATPQYGAAEKKKGRTRRRGSWRAAGPTKDEQAAPTTASEDVYEFRSSPESEGEDGEPTGPSNKRIRLTAAAAADTPSRAESNHSGELDGEEPDDVDDEDTKMSASTGPAKKVPPITLRLYGHQKTPSEDDGNEDAASNSLLTASYKESSAPPGMSSNGSVSGRRGGVGRGRFGKKGGGGEGDDHARVTRSRVRQGGKQLDDDQQLPRKKGRRPAGDVASIGEMDEQEAEGSVPPEPREHRAPPTFEGETPAQQLLLVNSYAGVIGLKDLIERRWRATVESTPRSQTLPEKHADYLVCTRDYPLRAECDEEDKPPQPPATVVPIMFDVWRKQEQKRVELRTKQRVARERARMMLEKERIRLERREINDAPAISAIQIIKEQSILNPLYLEEPQPRPPPLSRDAFSKKADEMKTDLFQRQKLDAGGLVAMQRSEWEWESRRRGVEFNKAILAQHIIPIDVVAISVEF